MVRIGSAAAPQHDLNKGWPRVHASCAASSCPLAGRKPGQVALAKSALPPALMSARAQGRALRRLGALAQLLQDLSEEVVVVWG